MQARELFSGAWILINGNPEQVDHICAYDDSTTVKEQFVIVFKGGDWETDDDDDVIEPIPLTAEILEKAGFTLYVDTTGMPINNAYRLNKLGLQLREKKGFYTVMWYDANDDYGCSMFVKVQHLHQLQNLYFALTGTELNIEL